MKKNQFFVSMFTIASLLAFSLTGCGGSTSSTSNMQDSSKTDPSKNIQTVRFSEVIRSLFYAPHYVAIEKGFFKEEGIQVDMVTSQGSDKGTAALLAGTADISLVGPETSIYVFNQNGEKKVKVFYQLTGTDGSFLLSRKKIDNFKWSDVSGKSVVGWRPGSAPQMVLANVLKKNNVNAEVITNIAAPAMVGAFESGKGDFIQVFEPVASMLEQSGKAYLVASMGEAMGTFPETSYVATTDYIAKHPDVIQAWTNAVYKATQWINSHSSDEAAAVIAPYFEGSSKELIAKSIERYKKLNTWPATPVMTKDQLNILQNVLIESGTLKPEQKVKYEDVVDTTFAEKAGKSGK
ncbi:ABC transporter substrate-binding protein [Effusibacillus pohliae]|uniref:ABC transporter substrate-binding protein n=1 Tax=Effusibacillus pohliae TaxID=232270 RepID=UPI001FDF170D|nr:ABC transporter substrate-binding protein [Effusibacillus pohliae]